MPEYTKKLYGDAFVNQFIAEMEGQRYNTRPFAFVDRHGNEYSHIAGAIVLPTFELHGYLIVAGVRHETNIIDCLEEFESENEYEIVKKAQDIQKRYGDGVVSMWWGNPKDLMTIVNEINDTENPVMISHPVDYDLPDAFQLYVSRLKVALARGYKTLEIRDCDTLRNNILAFVRDKSAKIGNNPVIAAAGSLIHTLLVLRPWEQAVEKIDLIPTMDAEMAAYERAQEEQTLVQEIFGVAS